MTNTGIKSRPLPDFFTNSLYACSPYSGCSHGCLYCDGRAEKYFVQGDFTKDIQVRSYLPSLVKKQVPLLREKGSICIGSGITDAYQPCEKKEELTRSCLQIIVENQKRPVVLLTKNDLILRDIDILSSINKQSRVLIMVSLTMLNDDIRKIIEPGASSVQGRLKVIEAFKEAGCAVGVLAMPFLPNITDSEKDIKELFTKLKSLNVDFIMPGGLTLRPGRQKDLFFSLVQNEYPDSLSYYEEIYSENRPSGMPKTKSSNELYKKFGCILKDFNMGYFLPHKILTDLLAKHDSLYVLLNNMKHVYADKGVNTKELDKSFNHYTEWLTTVKKYFRMHRNLDSMYLQDRFNEFLSTDEIHSVLKNDKLTSFVKKIHDGYYFDYVSLKLDK